MVDSILFLLVLAFRFPFVQSGFVPLGGNCSIANNRLDIASHVFQTDCDVFGFCSDNNTCIAKQCRRDEWPFGYPGGYPLPPMCSHSSYCPDEEDGCRSLVRVGGQCQVGRDDECEEDPMAKPLPKGLNSSICLSMTCYYTNATLGQSCVIDHAVYTAKAVDGNILVTNVTRSNCRRPEGYCDDSSTICVPTKAVGQPCSEDRECFMDNCGSGGVCADPPEMPIKIPLWQYIVTSLSLVAGIAATLVILVVIHKRHRVRRLLEVQDYYRQQMGYRRSVAAIQHAVSRSQSLSSAKEKKL